MKSILILALCGIAVFCGCKKTNENVPSEPQAQEVTYLTAIDNYMTEMGSQYAQGEYCIPYALIVATDESNPEDIKVWGDFRVENYNVEGDTLVNVSGGSHPGLMHVSKTDDGFRVVGFDAVGDGSDFLPMAKALFGDCFDAFMEMQSNDEAKIAARKQALAAYAAANNLPVTCYQDFGWPAEKISEE